MTLPKSKHLYLYFFLLLSLLFFIINIYQSQYFHWTAALDQDIMIIYNSLLISSGFEQEYRDHPAYTTFVIYAIRLADEGVLFEENPGALIAVLIAGVCVGFLPHNAHPAKIFMGEGGALMLGVL